MFSRWFFPIAVLCTACGPAWSSHSGGDSGKADFSYAGFVVGDENLDHAFLTRSDVTIRIRLHDDVRDTPITVTSADTATFTVSSFGRGTDRGEWQALVHGVKVGSAKLQTNGTDGKPLDTISLAVGEASKIVAPDNVVMSVGDKKRIETHVEDKDGKTLHVNGNLSWTLDTDVATFYSALDRQSGSTNDVGTIVDLEGNRPGPTLMHGRVGGAKIDVNVTVNK